MAAKDDACVPDPEEEAGERPDEQDAAISCPAGASRLGLRNSRVETAHWLNCERTCRGRAEGIGCLVRGLVWS